MSLSECDFYVGIDWGTQSQAVYVQDAAEKITATLGEKRMQALCVKHGFCGRRAAGPDAVRAGRHYRGPPGRRAGPGHRDAHRARSARTWTGSVTAHLGEHPDAAIFTSLPRSGQINAAQALAEWRDSRQTYDPPDAVDALGGLTPVSKASAKYHTVPFRWACNKRFRKAMTTFADNSRHESPWASDVYRRAIHGGHDRPHAVRVLARAGVRVIYRCRLNRELHPARHGNAIQINNGHQTAA